MANYEIMLVVNGSMSNEQAQESVKELTTIVDKLENYKFTNVGNLNISYRIKGQNMGWYFQYNFSTNVPNVINEFRRLASINKNVLRQLIINLDKDYGSRALKNTKKVEKSEKKLIQYNERMEKYKQEKFAQETAQRELEEMTNVKAEESNNE